ncbi:hypothetical protein GLOIN_2v1474482 [Rhizophagus clarus]|uniref:Uncharacterized protein n=1 Tax=Rhizophagus clarus TaxID=94130 RepID=A0A8H3MCD8_9GLOM|nr:hypothetical protein GLOIN_2v1474482 [Rhizophagus clarus]
MRGIIEGLLIRSIEFYGYNRSLSNEQLLKEAWIRPLNICLEPNISRDQEVILALSKENTYLELELAKLRNRFEVKQLSDIISPNEYYDFPRLSQELKRLKIQDLTIQIPLKKQEREQLTNTLKNNLNNSGKYLLDKLLKKQNKLLLNNEINSNKLEEIKTALGEDLEDDSERLTEILDKNKEIFNLEKHLEKCNRSLLNIEEQGRDCNKEIISEAVGSNYPFLSIKPSQIINLSCVSYYFTE